MHENPKITKENCLKLPGTQVLLSKTGIFAFFDAGM
jgi:hypothetical protein